jgi:hypothetical protein
VRLASIIHATPIAKIIVDLDYTPSQSLPLYTINISQCVTHALAGIQCTRIASDMMSSISCGVENAS